MDKSLGQLNDFRNFLYITWQHLNLPEPTKVQYDLADFLQNSPKRAIIQAFRGVGKSYITSAYVVWRLLLAPELKIMVVSASKDRADAFSMFTQRIIQEMPILAHLVPPKDELWSRIAFNVKGCGASHSPSVKSVGITGQLTGSRADLIIADDVEVPNNSQTQSMREKLATLVTEFDAVLKPLETSKILYLGTPQTEESLYDLLQDRGYITRIWPSRYPREVQINRYSDRLAPMLLQELEKDPELTWKPTDPKRFDEDDLLERELSYGRSGYALQFQLDTSLSDLDKHPLKLSDLIIMDVDNDKAPEKPIHGSLSHLEVKDIPNLGMRGDRYYEPLKTLGEWVDYSGSVLAIDPSGRGSDETAYAVIKMLNGYLYCPDAGGIKGGYGTETLTGLVSIAKANKVNYVLIESNFGDGMFSELIKPFFTKEYPVTLEEVRHSKQKELRIIDTLEPVMNQHRLVVDKKVVENDYKTIQQYPQDSMQRYSLFYQLTRLTRDRGALAHDDRLDALSMAVAYWVEQMASDADDLIRDRQEEMLNKELESFLGHLNTSDLLDGATSKSLMW
jgi:hypothetical protein